MVKKEENYFKKIQSIKYVADKGRDRDLDLLSSPPNTVSNSNDDDGYDDGNALPSHLLPKNVNHQERQPPDLYQDEEGLEAVYDTDSGEGREPFNFSENLASISHKISKNLNGQYDDI